MIISGQLILPHGTNQVRLQHGWLRVDSTGRIIDIGGGNAPGPVDLGGDDFVISPGFIDTHVHLPHQSGWARWTDTVGVAREERFPGRGTLGRHRLRRAEWPTILIKQLLLLERPDFVPMRPYIPKC